MSNTGIVDATDDLEVSSTCTIIELRILLMTGWYLNLVGWIGKEAKFPLWIKKSKKFSTLNSKKVDINILVMTYLFSKR